VLFLQSAALVIPGRGGAGVKFDDHALALELALRTVSEHAAYRLGLERGRDRCWFAHRLGWSHGYQAALQRAVEIGLGEAISEYDTVLARVLEVEEVKK
jgi:hypothetical protein